MNLNRFDLISLRLFVTVVDLGSLTHGAKEFGISLAAASKRIAELEMHVGQALLLRGKKGVIPSPAGEAMYRHSVELVWLTTSPTEFFIWHRMRLISSLVRSSILTVVWFWADRL